MAVFLFNHQINRLLCAFIFAFVLSFSPSVKAQGNDEDKNDFILVITSYTPDSKRVSTFVSDFKKTLAEKKTYPYDILMESMNFQGLDGAHLWKEQMKDVLDKYNNKHLKGIILLGQESWASFLSQDSRPNIPFFSYYVSKNGFLLNNIPQDITNWFPQCVNTKELADSLGGGGVMNHYDVEANVNLLRLLYPSIKNIAFLSDNTYGGVAMQASVIKTFNEKYPFLNLILLDSRIYTVWQLKDKIANLPKNTAILLGTWRVDYSGLYFLQNNISGLLPQNNTMPIFTLSGIGEGLTAIGGCTPDYSKNNTAFIANKIYDYYHEKKDTSSNFIVNKNKYVFYQNKLREYDLHDYQLPQDSVIIDNPDAQLLKYKEYFKKQIFLVIFLVIVIIFLFYLYHKNKNLRKELETAKEKAEESDRLKSAFLANMSHEIRTPLNAIVGFSNLLIAEDVSKEEKEQFGGIINENNSLLLKLINDVLDLSRIESNHIGMNNTRFDLSEHMKNVYSTMNVRMNNGVKLLYNIPYEHCYIYFDKSRLTQLATNFVTNAIKFTQSGYIKMHYELVNGGVKIYVEDTGIGIQKDKIELVFGRFEKLNDFAQGTGLGLSICKAIMDSAGGDIGVTSVEGKGSTFWIFIPTEVEIKK